MKTQVMNRSKLKRMAGKLGLVAVLAALVGLAAACGSPPKGDEFSDGASGNATNGAYGSP